MDFFSDVKEISAVGRQADGMARRRKKVRFEEEEGNWAWGVRKNKRKQPDEKG